MYSLINIIQVIIIFQGCLLTLFIFISNKEKLKSNLILAIIIGILTIQILGIFLAYRDIYTDFFRSTNGLYLFLYGPLLYFYSKFITFSEFKLKVIHFLHFLPFVIVLTMIWFTDESVNQSKLYIFYTIQILTYIFICFVEIHRYKKIIKDNYSRLEWLNLGWLQWTLIMFTLIVFVDVIQFGTFHFNFETHYLELTVYILVLTTINLLYFKGFSASRTSLGFNKDDLALSSSMTSRKRRLSSHDENKGMTDRLELHLISSESFKNPNLTIGLLAEEIGISKRTISELINDHYDQNFVDFINTYRINCAKKRLKNPIDPNETILEVMYDVGFNSKSSFNSAFKKKTGSTPTEFKSN